MLELKQILDAIDYIEFVGNPEQAVLKPQKLEKQANLATALYWCSDKNWDVLPFVLAGTIICSNKTPKSFFQDTCNYILVEHPRFSFQQILNHFFVEKDFRHHIDSTASIHPSVIMGQPVYIGKNVVLEENVEIGMHSKIDHNTVIKKDTKIANHVTIGCNNTIGNIGFGYEKNQQGSYEMIPHLGNVMIEDFVEIGNNTCIDRAVLGSTIIREHAKIDNLVHIAHGVDIGQNALIIANAMIAGSVKIGHNAWIAPSSSILNQKSVGDHAIVGMGAVVVRDVGPETTVVGNPAKLLPPKLSS